jgi:hypothetical protein
MIKPKKNPVTKLIVAGMKSNTLFPRLGVRAAKDEKVIAKKLGSNTAKKTVKATVKKKVVSRGRQAFDTPVSGSSAKSVIPKMGKGSLQISKNVAIKNAVSPSGKVSISGGANQVMSQNVRASLKKGMTKAEAKANARGLKAANKPTNKVGSKADKAIRKQTKAVRLSKDEEATLYDYYYGTPKATQTLSRKTPKNDARSVRKMPKKSK